jgi:hypothetical protein
MLHTSAQQRYEKLKKVFRRLMADFDRDNLDDFVAVANSLPSWICSDPAMSQEQKDALERFMVPNSVDWRICNDLANRQKHVRPKRNGKASFVKTVQIRAGGRGFRVPPSIHVFGAGEEIIVLCDHDAESALAFSVRTFRHFHYIFEVAPIPVEQRRIGGLRDILS